MIKKNKKGFTLIELLAVVTILAVLFLYVTPKLSTLIKTGGKTEIELLEQKVIQAAREYADDNSNVYDNLISEGDVNYIYKEQLIESKLIEETEISKLDKFTSVKIELKSNDKIEYSIVYEES